MRTRESASSLPTGASAAPTTAARERLRLSALTGGGKGGNEQLTAVTGVVLIVLLAALGLTIPRIHQLISMHLFLGLVLLGPLAVKMGSTGYRFVRYYTHDPAYRREGPPETLMRLIAPVMVLSTVLVFASGIVLLILGPSHRGPFVSIHKASFVVWLAFTGLHVLGHLPGLGASLRAARRDTGGLSEDPARRARDYARRGARRRLGARNRADPAVRAVDRHRCVPAPRALSERAARLNDCRRLARLLARSHRSVSAFHRVVRLLTD